MLDTKSTYKIMKNIFLIIYFIVLSFELFGQEHVIGDSVLISFVRMDKNISDSNSLFLKIAFRNISKRSISIYGKLQEGIINDRFCNVSVELEKLIAGSYVHQPTWTYHHNPDLEFADSLRHYDLPKMEVLPSGKDTLTVNLKHLGLGFEPGSYRVKISLRIQTILNTTPYSSDPRGETAPPEDTLKYLTSNWIYFMVTKKIFQSY
jgi:hypothetical protein